MGSTSSKAHGTSEAVDTVVLLIANFGHSQDPLNRLTKLDGPQKAIKMKRPNVALCKVQVCPIAQSEKGF